MAMELCGIPSVPLAAAAGVAYPTRVALAVVLASSVTAACVAYYVGRTRLRPRLDKRISNDRRLRAISAAVRDEGFDEIADWMETLAKAERSHANRFQKALDNLDA